MKRIKTFAFIGRGDGQTMFSGYVGFLKDIEPDYDEGALLSGFDEHLDTIPNEACEFDSTIAGSIKNDLCTDLPDEDLYGDYRVIAFHFFKDMGSATATTLQAFHTINALVAPDDNGND